MWFLKAEDFMKLKFKRGFGCPGEMHVQLRLVLEVDSDR